LDRDDLHPMLAVEAVVPLVGLLRIRQPGDAEDDEERSDHEEGEALKAAARSSRHGEGEARGASARTTGSAPATPGPLPRLHAVPAPLPRSFFVRPTLVVARDLLGALLVHETAGGRLAGRIVETEAYRADDPAIHGWKATFGSDGRVLPRGRAAGLFAAPGTAYVYKVYYTNWLLNVVTEPEGEAGAVLVRAVEPIEGEEAMVENRPASVRRRRDLTNGPGKLTQALGIAEGPEAARSRFHGADLTSPPLYFAEGDPAPDAAVATSSRIGLSRGADLPYRFYLEGHPFVSPGEPSDVRIARKTRRPS
jgi:DNA-3-methyladenine glycosylase